MVFTITHQENTFAYSRTDFKNRYTNALNKCDDSTDLECLLSALIQVQEERQKHQNLTDTGLFNKYAKLPPIVRVLRRSCTNPDADDKWISVSNTSTTTTNNNNKSDLNTKVDHSNININSQKKRALQGLKPSGVNNFIWTAKQKKMQTINKNKLSGILENGVDISDSRATTPSCLVNKTSRSNSGSGSGGGSDNNTTITAMCNQLLSPPLSLQTEPHNHCFSSDPTQGSHSPVAMCRSPAGEAPAADEWTTVATNTKGKKGNRGGNAAASGNTGSFSASSTPTASSGNSNMNKFSALNTKNRGGGNSNRQSPMANSSSVKKTVPAKVGKDLKVETVNTTAKEQTSPTIAIAAPVAGGTQAFPTLSVLVETAVTVKALSDENIAVNFFESAVDLVLVDMDRKEKVQQLADAVEKHNGHFLLCREDVNLQKMKKGSSGCWWL